MVIPGHMAPRELKDGLVKVEEEGGGTIILRCEERCYRYGMAWRRYRESSNRSLFRSKLKGTGCEHLLFARLGKNEVRHLTRIQRHQYDAFHVFLCYLAGAVLARDGSSNPVQDEHFWREAS